jgi:NADH-quinone oxidoreductase subunit E
MNTTESNIPSATHESPHPVPAVRMLSDAAYKRIDREVAKFPPEGKNSAVMAALGIAQDEKGWLSIDLMADVADYLSMPAIAVQEVATFYNMYNVEPRGRHKITVCTNLPCALSGGARAGEYLKGKLGIDYRETSADGGFTLLEGECMGACGDAPVMLVDNKRMMSWMSDEKIDALLAELNTKPS